LQLSAAKAQESDPDLARELGGKDYDSHILASKSRTHEGPLGEPGKRQETRLKNPRIFPLRGKLEMLPSSGGAGGEASERRLGEVLVTLNIRGTYASDHDAVADLERNISFRRDPRFEADGSGVGGGLSLWGWIPSQKIGEAMQIPGVARLEVHNRVSRPIPPRGVTSDILVGIRVPSEAQAAGFMETLSRELVFQTGLRWKKSVGFQRAPGSGELALLMVGEVPVKNLSQLMARKEVLKVLPLSQALQISAPSFGNSSGGLSQFFSFVLARAPLLIVLTLLLTLAALGRLFQVFV
jgi:hypothetical protein